MTTGATLFSGGELAGVGMRNAGIEHRWGREIDPAIAGVAQANDFNVLVANVLETDPHQVEPVDCLHASPECQRASTANQGAELNEDGTKETPLDRAFGDKIAQFIDVIQPRVFTLENVYNYRNFQAFKVICAALSRNGYFWDFDNLNSADFAVPQTRRRLILRAVRGALLPMLPQVEWWRGWYGAVENLIPSLPDSKFAAWQEEKLPEWVKNSILISSIDATIRQYHEPANTVVATGDGHSVAPRAFLVESRNMCEWGDGVRTDNEPAMTVTIDPKPSHSPKAFIVHPTDQRTMPVRRSSEPMFTVTTNQRNGNEPKALLVADEYGSPKNGKERILFTREPGEPAMTVKAQQKATYRAWLQHGRVVSMTPRALARFQSVPDSYVLPDKNGLACKVIGNGVPCLLMQKIYEGLIR